MGYINLNKSFLYDFEVQIINEEGRDVLYVTIKTEDNSIKYKISTDERHDNLEQIKNDFINGLNLAKNTVNFAKLKTPLQSQHKPASA